MELIAEIIAAAFQILVEFGLQAAAELFGELGFKAIGEMWQPSRPAKPASASLGYFLVGLLLGWISLWPFPHRLAGSVGLRLLSLALLPVANAACVWVFLTVIQHPEGARDRRHRFWFAYAFGVAFALVRFTYGR